MSKLTVRATTGAKGGSKVAGVLAALALLLQILASSAAVAQQSDGDDSAYSQVLAEAVAEYQRGNWAEARSLFTKVHRMKPSARSLRGLAMASFEGRWYVEAVVAARESLDH